MPRKKNDGRGRLGGRQAGTPNKDNPLKSILHAHSVEYFTPNINADDVDFLKDANGETLAEYRGLVLSKYDLDLIRMKASDRAKAELDLLGYHTPKMQAVSADLSVTQHNMSIAMRISKIAAGESITNDDD